MNTISLDKVADLSLKISDIAAIVIKQHVLDCLSDLELEKIHSAVGFELLDRKEGKHHD